MNAFDISSLSDVERELLKRFHSIETSPVSSFAYKLYEEGRRPYSDDVFLIMCEDVFNMLYITELDKESVIKMIYFAHGVYANKLYESYEFPETPIQCLLMLWITFFTEYKNHGRIYKNRLGIEDIGKSEFNTYYSICENYLNLQSPRKNEKREAFSKLVSLTLGADPLNRKSDPDLSFTTLIALLDMNDLTYSPHEGIMIK